MISFLTQLIMFADGPDAMAGWEKVLHMIPLIVCSSLVYGATRHENWKIIGQESLKLSVWLLFFTGCVFVVVLLFSFFN